MTYNLIMSKYLSEFTLGLYVQYKYLVPSYSVYNLEPELRKHPYHLYFIVATPKWFFKEGGVTLMKDRFSAVIFSDQFGERIEKTVGISFEEAGLDLTTFTINIPHPGTNLFLVPPEGAEKAAGFEADFLAREHCWRSVLKYDLHKVLYIGQAYGKNGERLSIDRILSHSTFQKILMEAPIKYPTYKIEVLFLDFAINQTLSVGGTESNPDIIKDSLQHLNEVLSSPVKINEAYNICEATLIYAFQPEYNKDFKKYYPSKAHKSYQAYYNLDYKNLWLELDLSFGNRPDCILFTNAYHINSSFIDMVYDLRNNKLYKTAREYLDVNFKS